MIKAFPIDSNVCLTPCVLPNGNWAVYQPDYSGYATLEHLIRQELRGEYNPIFRGTYIRTTGYIDLSLRKSCGTLTYYAMAQHAAFWVSASPMRIYNYGRSNSTSANPFDREKARESFICFTAIEARHGQVINTVDPAAYRKVLLRASTYGLLGGQGRHWQTLRRAKAWQSLDGIVASILMLLGERVARTLLTQGARLGIVGRFG